MQLKGNSNSNFLYLDGLHGTDHQNSFHHPGTEPAQQASGAVQSTRLIPGTVTEELKHTKPEEEESRTQMNSHQLKCAITETHVAKCWWSPQTISLYSLQQCEINPSTVS